MIASHCKPKTIENPCSKHGMRLYMNVNCMLSLPSVLILLSFFLLLSWCWCFCFLVLLLSCPAGALWRLSLLLPPFLSLSLFPSLSTYLFLNHTRTYIHNTKQSSTSTDYGASEDSCSEFCIESFALAWIPAALPMSCASQVIANSTNTHTYTYARKTTPSV